MEHDAFIGQVQQRARLSSRGDAEGVTRATLETLGERIPEGLADNLAAQLPREIGEHLRRTVQFGGMGTGERFDRNEFITRVCEGSHSDDRPATTYRARAVFEVVEDATSPSLMAKVRDALPDDLRELATAGSSGGMGR